MAGFLRLESLTQEIACQVCGSKAPAWERRRTLNFTTNVVRLFCANCRSEIGRIPFGRWNTLHEKAPATRHP